jgi:Lipase (class 3)
VVAGRYTYAIDELRDLVGRVNRDDGLRDLTVRYVCALFAELAYYHIPQWEIDEDQHRAKVIPCAAYQALRGEGLATDVLGLLSQREYGRAFVAVDRGVIAVGQEMDDLVFIGFRGTTFLYDWKINLRSKLVLADPDRFYFGGGRVHAGFAEEAFRISLKVADALREWGLSNHRIFLSGHSLGGAVAALARNSDDLWRADTCIFGAPRYCDLAAYMAFPGAPPLHVRRPADMIPTVPPRRKGYVDHPSDFATSGRPFFELKPRRASAFDSTRSWGKLSVKRFSDHGMKTYRSEVGKAANSRAAELELTAFDRLRRRD